VAARAIAMTYARAAQIGLATLKILHVNPERKLRRTRLI